MSRAEIRRAQATKTATYNMTKKQLEDMSTEAYKKGYEAGVAKARKELVQDTVDEINIILFGIPLKILHDEYGWGLKKRLPEFSDHMIDYYQSFTDGDMTIEKYRDYIYETVGLKIEKVGGSNEQDG